MFTCPKCKTTWSSTSFICTCGERVLYIPDELKEKTYLVYGVSGYDGVVSYIKSHNENIKLESIKKIESNQRQVEIDTANKQEEAEQDARIEDRRKRTEKIFLVFSLLAFASFIFYSITPSATRFISTFVSCEVGSIGWKLSDYLFFWVKTAGFIFLVCGLLLYFFYVIRAAIFGDIRLDVERGEKSRWMINSAILFSTRRGSGLTDAASGAVVGAVTHHAYYTILDALKVFFILILPIFVFLKFSNKIYCSSQVQSAAEFKTQKGDVESVKNTNANTANNNVGSSRNNVVFQNSYKLIPATFGVNIRGSGKSIFFQITLMSQAGDAPFDLYERQEDYFRSVIYSVSSSVTEEELRSSSFRINFAVKIKNALNTAMKEFGGLQIEDVFFTSLEVR